MKTQHAERDYAPFFDEIHARDPDRDKLVMEAFRELLAAEDDERRRARQSKAWRRTASRRGEVFAAFGRRGVTVRDRNRLVGTLLERISVADRDAGRAIVRRGRPERFKKLVTRFCYEALRPQDYAANGLLTEEGCNRVASAVFHAKRWYLAERVGLGAIPVRSVADAWFLTWLVLSDAEAGAILTAATELRDIPQARSDEHLRKALARARRPRSYAKGEGPAEAEARLARVARLRWRQLQKLGAATPRDLMSFDDPRR